MGRVGVEDLSTELWRQRELLDRLLFKFEEQRLLLVAGRSRWLPFATEEIENVAGRLKMSALTVSVMIADTARELGLADDAKLRDIVVAAPSDAWREVLASHLDAMTGLVADVQAVQTGNGALLRSALRNAQETLRIIADPVGGYTADGAPAAPSPGPHRVDTDL